MGEDPRIAAIRRAFEEARFDERTPDEKGFAEVFESRVKPELYEGIVRAVERERKTRVRVIIGGFISLVVWGSLGYIGFATWEGAEPFKHFAAFIGGGLFCTLWIFVYAFQFGVWAPPDPAATVVMNFVLESRGSRFVTVAANPMNPPAPVLPAGTVFRTGFECIEGLFGGRLPYGAARMSVGRPTEKGNGAIFTFIGWYLRIDLPFSFNGTTVMWVRGAETNVPDGIPVTEVELEDRAFTERFEVFSTDQVEARIILAPDVMHHLLTAGNPLPKPWGRLMLGFSERHAHVWIPSQRTALSAWHPLDPQRLIEDIHAVFAELATIQSYIRDIDVIAESEGFRAQAARQGRNPSS